MGRKANGRKIHGETQGNASALSADDGRRVDRHVAAPFVRGAHAAGKLSIGFWDHWVPGANNATEALIEEWAAKEKVEVQIDFITSQGNKHLLTIAAEAQAKSGHDILAFPTWRPQRHAEQPRAGQRHHGAS